MKTRQANTQINSLKGKFKTSTRALVVAAVIASVTLPAAAKKHRDYGNSAYDYAKVVEVVPVVETQRVNHPIETCWDERVPRRVQRSGYNNAHKSYTGEIFGAIIGAAVGNQFGRGRGKKVATAAGAVLGGSVARDIKHGNRHNREYARNHRGQTVYDTVQRCETRDSYVSEERIVGYDVAYKYRGNIFQTQMSEDPGDKIKVRVTVDPV